MRHIQITSKCQKSSDLDNSRNILYISLKFTDNIDYIDLLYNTNIQANSAIFNGAINKSRFCHINYLYGK